MRPGRLCAHRGAQPPPQRSSCHLAGLTDHDGRGSLAVADGFALRLGELAVAVALHGLRRRRDEARMGLLAVSAAPRGTGRRPLPLAWTFRARWLMCIHSRGRACAMHRENPMKKLLVLGALVAVCAAEDPVVEVEVTKSDPSPPTNWVVPNWEAPGGYADAVVWSPEPPPPQKRLRDYADALMLAPKPDPPPFEPRPRPKRDPSVTYCFHDRRDYDPTAPKAPRYWCSHRTDTNPFRTEYYCLYATELECVESNRRRFRAQRNGQRRCVHKDQVEALGEMVPLNDGEVSKWDKPPYVVPWL